VAVLHDVTAGENVRPGIWGTLAQRGEHRLRQALLKFPLVLNSFGSVAVFMAAMFLVVAYLTDDEMLKAFWLGAFTTSLLGAIVLFGTTKITEVRRHQREARLQKAHDAMLRQLVEASPIMFSYVDRDGRYRLNNRSYERWLGASRDELFGRRVSEVLGERPYREIASKIDRALRGESVRYERLLPTLDGGYRYVDTLYTPHFNERGRVEGFFDMAIDITDRKRVERALRDSEERHRTLIENAPVCILEISLGGHLETVNPAGRRMIGEDEHAHVFGLSFLDIVSPSDRERVKELLDRARSGESSQFEFSALIGKERRVFSASLIPLRGPEGDVSKIMEVMQDVTDAHNLADELSYQASYDALTGLVNRREFEQRLHRVLETARRDKTENALCYLDLDQFKIVNDTCGHIAGDELLRQLGSVLKKGVRKRDSLARLGGDEFGILMEHCSLEQAKRVASDLCDRVSDFRFTWGQKSFAISVSIGVVPITETSGRVSDVLSAADSACYAAKDTGRNRIHVSQQNDQELARRHGEMQWVPRIKTALEENRFKLAFQPIVSVNERFEDGEHYEILLRMEDEGGDLVPPTAFLPAAERYDLAVEIDRYVFRTATDWLASRPEVLRRIALCSMNLTTQSLVDRELLHEITAALESGHVPPEKICFEITESSVIANLTSATRFISTLKKIGCRFTLDQFGSGLSSLAYLKTLPVDYLKIDGALIREIVHNPVNLAIVRSINEIGQVMEKHTIAAFVESEDIAEKLRDIGIDYCQGNYVAQPRPIDELE